MDVTDVEAFKKWSQIPKDLQQRLINNVFCRKCFNTKIIDYTIHNDDQGVLLKGKCEKCGGNVTRLVEGT